VNAGRGLTLAERDSLDRDGYLLVPSLMDKAVLARLRSRLGELVREAVAAWEANPEQKIAEPGVVRVKLGAGDRDFAPCHEHRLLAEAATAVLGPDWHVSGLLLRAPLPGCGHQGLHPDFEQRQTQGPWQALSAMWCICAFTAANGPLRVIPGSHQMIEPPIDMLAFGSGMGPHPDEVKIAAPAGSVILFNSADLWHSGTFNYTPDPRLAVTAGFAPGRLPC
jgi:ectoine hydroxylase-related dioxygenase (phytanoyl-CoA dioxygenase family)